MLILPRNRFYQIFLILLIFWLYTILWVFIQLSVPEGSTIRDYFTDSYGLVAGVGGLLGLFVAQNWGGLQSKLGKALTLFSIGLLFQFLGQLSYAYVYYMQGVENPYPSFGEVFYFGSIFIYIFAVLFLSKASHSSFKKADAGDKALAIVIPVFMVGLSYFTFLKGRAFDSQTPIISFLDYGYPLGQAVYVSLAITAYFLSKNVLGGVLKKPILFILFALVLQYMADSVFLYETINEHWVAGGKDDFLFLLAYTSMGLAIQSFGVTYDKINFTKHGR